MIIVSHRCIANSLCHLQLPLVDHKGSGESQVNPETDWVNETRWYSPTCPRHSVVVLVGKCCIITTLSVDQEECNEFVNTRQLLLLLFSSQPISDYLVTLGPPTSIIIQPTVNLMFPCLHTVSLVVKVPITTKEFFNLQSLIHSNSASQSVHNPFVVSCNKRNSSNAWKYIEEEL